MMIMVDQTVSGSTIFKPRLSVVDEDRIKSSQLLNVSENQASSYHNQ